MADKPKYKVIYFDNKGRAEAIRWMFEVAGVAYEDCRLTKEQWPQVKPKMPFGQVPVLEVDGVLIAESATICRFLAAEFGLQACSALAQARGDMIADALMDSLTTPVSCIIRQSMLPETERDQKAIDDMAAKYAKDTFPTGMSYFEQLLQHNSGVEVFWVEDKMTWYDIFFAAYITTIILIMKSLQGIDLTIDQFPKVNALISKVTEHPKIADWIKRRPVTQI